MTPFQDDVTSRALAFGTSTLYESSGLDCSVDPLIRSLWPGAAIAAPAYPLLCAPGDNLAIHIALERAPQGSVLVVGTHNFVAGYWGEVLTVAAQAVGLVGLVIDGGVRDVAAMTRLQFPVFTRGVSVRGTIKASAPSVGRPIHFTGVRVSPGDLVVGDDDGVIVLPQSEVGRTLDRAAERASKEAGMMEKLRQGHSTLELMGLQTWRGKD